MGPLLSLGQTAGGWSPSVALGLGGPSPCVSTLPGERRSHQVAALTAIPWEQLHTGERTRGQTDWGMRPTYYLGSPGLWNNR